MKQKISLCSLALLFVVLSSCNIISSVTGIEFDSDWKQQINRIPEFSEGTAYAKKLESVETNTNYVTTETNNDTIDSTRWVGTTKTYSAAENPEEFVMYNPMASVLWPGNLVQGDSLAGGVPNSIPVYKRLPATITLDIISGQTNLSRTVDQPSMSTVYQAMNDILAGYQGTTPANISYILADSYSAKQMEFDLGMGYSSGPVKLSASLGLDWNTQKRRVAVKLIQQFFTMTYQDPQGMDGVFTSNFTLSDIDPYIGPANPPCYISSVTFGRVYVIVYEANTSDFNLKTELNLAYNAGMSLDADARYQFDQTMRDVSVKLFMMGGDPQAALLSANPNSLTNYDTISNFLVGGANFSPTNIGVPISYTVKYLKNAKKVRMNSTLEYKVKQLESFSEGSSKKKSHLLATLESVRCLYQGESGLYVGSVNLYLNKETGTPDYSYTLPSAVGASYWKTGQLLNVYTNFPTLTLDNSADSYIKAEFTVYQETTNTNNSLYKGVASQLVHYDTNSMSWYPLYISNQINFLNANGSSNSLASVLTISRLP